MLLVIVLLLVLIGPFFAPHAPAESLGLPGASPDGSYSLGTDKLGRDVLSRTLWGGRSVVALALAATAACYAIGLLIGVTAGLQPAARGAADAHRRRRARVPAAALLPDHRHRASGRRSGC